MEMDKKAKKAALEAMKMKNKKGRMEGIMKDMPAKKVVVGADSEEGLKEGLSMAQQIMDKREDLTDDEKKGVTVEEPLMGKEFSKKKRK